MLKTEMLLKMLFIHQAVLMKMNRFFLVCIGISTWYLAAGNLLTSEGCGSKMNCFKSPDTCSSSADCDFLFKYKYNVAAKTISFAISGMHEWISVGFRTSETLKMDDNIGHICTKQSSNATLMTFTNTGYSASFNPYAGLSNVVTSVVNGYVICQYTRTVVTPKGTNLRDLNSKWYITASFGTMSGATIRKHRRKNYISSSSPVDFKEVSLVVASKLHVDRLLVLHGTLMTLGWGCFAVVGVLSASLRLAWGEREFAGKQIWLQLHRTSVCLAMVFSFIGLLFIFIRVRGWSSMAGAHPYVGMITVVFGVIQIIAGVSRPSPTSQMRWIFNWGHRSIGMVTLILGGVTSLLGCRLIDISIVPNIIWFVFLSVIIVVMKIILCHLRKCLESTGDITVEQQANPTAYGLSVQSFEMENKRKLLIFMWLIVLVFVSIIGFTNIGFILN